jgi:hypothetical protein
VDHTKKIIAATEGHKGARNDKTVVKYDGFVMSIHEGKVSSYIILFYFISSGSDVAYLIILFIYCMLICLFIYFRSTRTSSLLSRMPTAR